MTDTSLPTVSATRTLLFSSAFLAGPPFLMGALSVLSTAYIIRSLGPSEYGRWATAAALAGATTIFSNLGLRPLFIRALADHPADRPRLLSEQLGVRVILGGLAAGLGVLCSILLGYSNIVVRCSAVFGAGLILTTVWTVFGDYLQAAQRFRTYSLVTLSAGLVLTATSVVVVWAGGGAFGLAWAYLTGPCVSAVAFAAILFRRGELVAPRVSRIAGLRLIAQSRLIAVSQLVDNLRERGEQLVLPKVVGEGPFGVFAGSIMPADRLNMLADAVATATYPRMADSRQEHRRAYASQLVTWVTLISSAAGAMLFVAAPLAAVIMMPTHFALVVDMMRFTAIGIPAAGLIISCTYSLQAHGKHEIAAKLTVWLSLVSIAATLVLIVFKGIEGAVEAWVLRQYLLGLPLAGLFAREFQDVSLPVTRILTAMTALILAVWLLSSSSHSASDVTGRAFAVLVLFLGVVALLKLHRPPAVE